MLGASKIEEKEKENGKSVLHKSQRLCTTFFFLPFYANMIRSYICALQKNKMWSSPLMTTFDHSKEGTIRLNST
jgi:hypothetical protein